MSALDDLSNSERKVGRALLAQYPTAGLTTVADLAEASGVSPPTVVRFVTRLGFTGFPAFQRFLVHELNGELGSPLKQYPEKGGPSELGVLPETYRAFSELLTATYDELPETEFTKLDKLLSDPNRQVRETGGRFSRSVSDYLAAHLRLLRSGVHTVGPDGLDRRTTIADADAGTVFVIYDYRRYTEQALVFATQMAGQGATVCLMTDNWMSPIAKVARVVIPARVDSASPFDSLVASMAVTESIVAAVAERLGDAGVRRRELLEETSD
jgi:DNA-binding MurR/RpiR family transcriptional regulator